MSRKRRANGTIDKLKPALKDTVDQMLLSGQTYREICQYLAENDVKLTQASVSRYARRFLASANELRIAQENFRMISENCSGKFQNDFDRNRALS